MRLSKLAQITLVQYNVLDAKSASYLVKQFLRVLIRLMDTRGTLSMIQQVKTWRNMIMRFILGNPLIGSPGADSEGWPKALTFAKIHSSSPNGIRSLLTLLMLTRAFSQGGVPDLSTIEDKPTGSDKISEQELRSALTKLRIPKATVPNWSVPHITTKRGPMGQALLTCLNELTLLPHDLIESINLLGGSSLSEFITSNTEKLDILSLTGTFGSSVAEWWKNLFATNKNTFRKLSYFSDKEDKVRVIALLDYWSQSALRPLHMKVNSFLRRISTDMTFNQGAFTNNVMPTLPGGNMYHSIDLSAATDRMPLTLQ